MSTRTVHIIGARPAGLAAALHLTRAGWHPVIFGQADVVLQPTFLHIASRCSIPTQPSKPRRT